MKTRELNIRDVRIGGDAPLCLIAGPCVIEGPDKCMSAARELKDICAAAGMPLIFKASFDKANRSSVKSFRGPGLRAGLQVLKAIRDELSLPILTDIHEPHQADPTAEVADILQIPAYLCRQTDLLVAAGETGRAINVKKGQFLAPGDMRNVIDKIRSTDNDEILLTERGSCFGYHYLVNDMRSLPVMRMMGYPIVFDATHSVQIPGGMGFQSGGERHFVAPLARAAVATGVDALFVEVHNSPDDALSDGANMLALNMLPNFLRLIKKLDATVKESVLVEEFDVRTRKPGSADTLYGLRPAIEKLSDGE